MSLKRKIPPLEQLLLLQYPQLIAQSDQDRTHPVLTGFLTKKRAVQARAVSFPVAFLSQVSFLIENNEPVWYLLELQENTFVTVYYLPWVCPKQRHQQRWCTHHPRFIFEFFVIAFQDGDDDWNAATFRDEVSSSEVFLNGVHTILARNPHVHTIYDLTRAPIQKWSEPGLFFESLSTPAKKHVPQFLHAFDQQQQITAGPPSIPLFLRLLKKYESSQRSIQDLTRVLKGMAPYHTDAVLTPFLYYVDFPPALQHLYDVKRIRQRRPRIRDMTP